MNSTILGPPSESTNLDLASPFSQSNATFITSTVNQHQSVSLNQNSNQTMSYAALATAGGNNPISAATNAAAMNQTQQQAQQSMRQEFDIFKAAKSGLLIACQDIIDRLGTDELTRLDSDGASPIHWAALGGHVHVLRFFAECRVPLDIRCNNNLGSQPIHWACCNGHIGAVDILLNNDVNIDTLDNKGCSPLIIAAQFGRTSLAGYLMGRGARLQLVDKEGDNALHWAAFKGHNELVRLLVHSGFNPRQKDNFGQTVLHLACLSGTLQTVMDLVEQDGVELDTEDHNGNKPTKLAEGRKNWEIVAYMNRALKRHTSIFPQIDMSILLFGPPGKSKLPMLFCLFGLFVLGYPTYIFKILPGTIYELQTVHLIFVFTNILMLIFLVKTHNTDPGTLAKNTNEYDHSIRQMAFYDAWRQNDAGYNPLNRLCHTCRLVKPPRAKHCKITNRCVRHFDHYCPYVYNTIGFKNRHYFGVFVTLISLCCFFTHYMSYKYMQIHGRDYWIYACNCLCSFFTLMTTALAIMTWYQAGLNMTTNERSCAHRYEYLKDSNGRFYNPYDRGFWTNVKEFLHRVKVADEVTVLQKTVDSAIHNV